MICKEREYNQQRKRTRPNRKCRKCIRANAQKVKKDAQLKNRVTSHVKMKQSEFIKLGKAYFWHFDWIDPFTGNIQDSILIKIFKILIKLAPHFRFTI